MSSAWWSIRSRQRELARNAGLDFPILSDADLRHN